MYYVRVEFSSVVVDNFCSQYYEKLMKAFNFVRNNFLFITKLRGTSHFIARYTDEEELEVCKSHKNCI